MKIKTFQFLISNYVGNACFSRTEDEYYSSPRYNYGTLNTSKDIDATINDFIKNKMVLDIKVENYTIHRHNNGYCDSVIAKYTILYEEEEQ